MPNRCVSFYGSPEHIYASGLPEPGLGSATYVAWINPTTAATGNAQGILGLGRRGAAEGGVSFLINGTGNLQLIADDGSNQVGVVSTAVLSSSTTYMVVGVIDRTTDEIALYINGVEDGREDISAVGDLSGFSDPSHAAAYQWTSTLANYFDGYLDEIAIFSDVVSGANVSSLYATGVDSWEQYAIDLIALSPELVWHLDETSGTTVVDSANSYNGTYSGSLTIDEPGLLGSNPATVNPDDLPMVLSGFFQYPAADLPMELIGSAVPDDLPIVLNGSLLFPAADLPLALSGSWPAADIPMTLSGSISSPAADLPMALTGDSVAANLAMRLSGTLSHPAADMTMRLNTATVGGQADLPLILETQNVAHMTANAARWNVAVSIAGANTSRLVNYVKRTNEENGSGICRFSFIPSAGNIDPSAYERKHCTVSFVGKDDNNNTTYSLRRFTGEVSVATYDPDAGVMHIEAIADLPGRFEELSTTAIDSVIPGDWSEHVFEASVGGWQYAQDRLSTSTHCVFIDENGNLQTVSLTAAASGVSVNDSGRFANTLKIERPSLRDLITRVRVNFDFRYVRLRHREISVQCSFGYLCNWLDEGYNLPSKATITAASNSSAWTRTSDIYWNELPGPIASVCTPPRAWAGNGGSLCLGASWKAARRWAQTITEEFAIDVVCPDLEESIGQRGIAEDYGVEAVYDATDFENVTAFDGPPSGATLLPETNDWTAEATDSVETGRAALEHAISVAIAKARATIVNRARGWRVTVECPWRPDITVKSTVSINTHSLSAKGKVFSIEETFDLQTGEPTLIVTLALTRHDGSGGAAETPLDPPPSPTQEPETNTGRTAFHGIRKGGLSYTKDDPEWSGWITNVAPVYQLPGRELYDERFALELPEIEESARDAAVIVAPSEYTVSVPKDDLTMRY